MITITGRVEIVLLGRSHEGIRKLKMFHILYGSQSGKIISFLGLHNNSFTCTKYVKSTVTVLCSDRLRSPQGSLCSEKTQLQGSSTEAVKISKCSSYNSFFQYVYEVNICSKSFYLNQGALWGLSWYYLKRRIVGVHFYSCCACMKSPDMNRAGMNPSYYILDGVCLRVYLSFHWQPWEWLTYIMRLLEVCMRTS